MPNIISHGLIGFGLTRAPAQQGEGAGLLWRCAVVISVLPDADSLLMRWIPYEHTFGHRGFSHGLLFAVILGAAAALVCRRCWTWFPGRAAGVLALFIGMVALHDVLDAFTDGGLGVAFFSPFSNHRWFMPWQPLPVSPFSPVHWFASWGAFGRLVTEAVMIWPAALALPVLRSRLERPWNVVAACAMLVVSAAVWAVRLA